MMLINIKNPLAGSNQSACNKSNDDDHEMANINRTVKKTNL